MSSAGSIPPWSMGPFVRPEGENPIIAPNPESTLGMAAP
jgi:hypothetical protein